MAGDRADGRASIKGEETYEALREKGYGKSKAARISNAPAKEDMSPSHKGGKVPPYEDWNKDALLDRARELDISGRSKMVKAELIDALRSS